MSIRKPTISLFSLVIANLLPLAGVAVFDWDAAAIVLLYWAENGVVGALTVTKMSALRESSIGSKLGSMFLTVPFFCVHYGGFWMAHGVLLIYLFGLGEPPPEYEPVESYFFLDFILAPCHMARHVVLGIWSHRPLGMEWGLAALSASHLVSFFQNFIVRGERNVFVSGRLMVHPYLRVFFGTVVALVGGWAAESGKAAPGIAMLYAIVLTKLCADIISYSISHRSRPRPSPHGV